MVGKRTEERVEFDAEIRKKILLKTNCRCAACGDKLDMVRHTIDHIIPISRGGTNDMENLIGLCKICNEYKDNLVYYPGDYYTYFMITNSKSLTSLHEYVVNYLKEEVHNLDIHRYPLISPCTTALLCMNGIMPKGYIRQLLFDIVYMRSDMRRANSGKVNFLKGYPYYGVIKRSTQKLVAIMRIDYSAIRDGYCKDGVQLTVFDEWSECSNKMLATLLKKTGEVLSSRYYELGLRLDEVCLSSRNEKIPEIIYADSMMKGFGFNNTISFATICEGVLYDREDLGPITCFCVSRERRL